MQFKDIDWKDGKYVTCYGYVDNAHIFTVEWSTDGYKLSVHLPGIKVTKVFAELDEAKAFAPSALTYFVQKLTVK